MNHLFFNTNATGLKINLHIRPRRAFIHQQRREIAESAATCIKYEHYRRRTEKSNEFGENTILRNAQAFEG